MVRGRWLMVLPIVGMTAGVSLAGSAWIDRVPPPAAISSPVRMVPLPASSSSAVAPRATTFQIDALQVSVADYGGCVRAGVCSTAASASGPDDDDADRHRQSAWCYGGRMDRADRPMNCVNATQADAYCRWVGKRLPTRQEWLDAVRLLQHENGETWSRDTSPPQTGEARPVPLPAEWTATSGDSGRRAGDPTLRQTCTSRGFYTPKGAVWQDDCRAQRVAARKPHISFRCAR